MSIGHDCPAHAYLFYIQSAFFLEESELIAKIRKLVGLRVRFYHFLYAIPKISHKCLANLPLMIPPSGRFAFILAVFALF